MPSGHSLSGTGWTVSDFGGVPAKEDVEVGCERCDTTTTADKTDGWDTRIDMETYETTVLCPSCQGETADD